MKTKNDMEVLGSSAASIMKTLVMSFTLLAAGCHSPPTEKPASVRTEDKKAEVATPAALPEEASRVAERLASCTHFSGEFNGDQSQHDKEVAAVMDELNCGTIEQDTETIRKKYADDASVLAALDAATEL